MVKEEYNGVYIEIITFDETDIIITSSNEEEGPIE